MLGDAIIAAMPSTQAAARANRAFLGRAVRYLVREAGIRQFLDIGTGIPAAGSVHEVAQSAAPESRVIYVDNDPVVMAHARALMGSHPAGATAFIQADLREPHRILASPELRATLDLGRPVALLLIAVLHFLTEQEAPLGIVAETRWPEHPRLRPAAPVSPETLNLPGFDAHAHPSSMSYHLGVSSGTSIDAVE